MAQTCASWNRVTFVDQVLGSYRFHDTSARQLNKQRQWGMWSKIFSLSKNYEI